MEKEGGRLPVLDKNDKIIPLTSLHSVSFIVRNDFRRILICLSANGRAKEERQGNRKSTANKGLLPVVKAVMENI